MIHIDFSPIDRGEDWDECRVTADGQVVGSLFRDSSLNSVVWVAESAVQRWAGEYLEPDKLRDMQYDLRQIARHKTARKAP